MTEKNLHKYSLRLFQEDVEAIQAAYPNFGYQAIVRHVTAKLADKIREGRQGAIDEVVSNLEEG